MPPNLSIEVKKRRFRGYFWRKMRRNDQKYVNFRDQNRAGRAVAIPPIMRFRRAEDTGRVSFIIRPFILSIQSRLIAVSAPATIGITCAGCDYSADDISVSGEVDSALHPPNLRKLS